MRIFCKAGREVFCFRDYLLCFSVLFPNLISSINCGFHFHMHCKCVFLWFCLFFRNLRKMNWKMETVCFNYILASDNLKRCYTKSILQRNASGQFTLRFKIICKYQDTQKTDVVVFRYYYMHVTV